MINNKSNKYSQKEMLNIDAWERETIMTNNESNKYKLSSSSSFVGEFLKQIWKTKYMKEKDREKLFARQN